MRKYLILIILILISTGNFVISSEWKAVAHRVHPDVLNLITNRSGELFYAAQIADDLGNDIYCYNTMLYHSSDAGYTWDEFLRIPTKVFGGDTNVVFDGYSSSLFFNPFKSQMVEDSIIYIFLKYERYFLKSKDTGKTWNAYEMPGLYNLFQRDMIILIDMFDENIGSAKVYNDTAGTHLILTEDQWETVELMPFPGTNEKMIYTNYSRPEKDVFYFSCRDWAVHDSNDNYESDPNFYYLSKTTDRGETWAEYKNNHYVLDLEITMADKNKGYMYGGQLDSVYTESPYLVNVIYQTLDGGESWQRILNVRDSAQGINELVYIDSLNMIASSRYSRRTQSPSPFCFYHTYDGGKTWERKFMEDSTFGSSVGSPRNLVVANKDEAYCKMMWNIFAYTDREVGVDETIGNEEPLLQISPNPVRRGEGAVLSYSGIGMGPVDVSVYDLSGRLIDNFQIRHPEWGKAVYMLPGNIGSGVYIVHFNFIGKNLSAKLVVE